MINFKKNFIVRVITLSLLLTAPIFGHASNNVMDVGIPFILNRGQADDGILAYTHILGGQAAITKNGEIVYYLKDCSFSEHIISVKPNCPIMEKPVVSRINYFIGSDYTRWVRNVPSYNIVNYGEVYNGIDLRLHARGNNVEKIFHIKPGADANDIRIYVEGATDFSINEAAELVIDNQISFTAPVAYQVISGRIKYIDVAYRIEGNGYGFILGVYNKDLPLIIDPLLASTFLGGSGDDGWQYTGVIDNCIDNEGNPLVAGMTASLDFPNLPGHYECGTCGNTDLFIAKFNKDLTELLAVAVIGGGGDERYPKIRVASNGDIYLLGQSYSTDYPTTSGAFRRTYTGNGDIVISRFDQELTLLLSSTYIGGMGVEIFPSLDLDNSDNVFISGLTSHDSYPTVEGSYRRYIVGSDEYFVSKLSPDLSTLIASTFIGGQYQERHTAMTVAPSGQIIMTGTTASPDYPTTPGAYDETFNGLPPYSEYNNDAVVSIFDNGLTTLLASTFVGAEEYEGGILAAVDIDGFIYFGGHTVSVDYPTTPGAFDEGHNGINEFFITKMSPDLASLEASTLLTPDRTGNDGFVFINGLSFDPENRLVMVGAAWDDYFYTTGNAYDRSFNGGMNDLAVMVMTDDLTAIEYSTYLGGSGNEGDGSVTVVSPADIYIASYSSSSDFPIIPGGWQSSHAGGMGDCVVARLTTNQFTSIPEGPQASTGIAVEATWIDINNDEYPDIYVTMQDANNYLFQNNGDGTFSQKTDDIIISEGYSIRSFWGDLNNDGSIDAIVVNNMHQPIGNNYFYLNDGSGNFSKVTDDIIVSDSGGYVICGADYNNDGALDIFIGSWSFSVPSNSFLYNNDGAGHFAKVTSSDVTGNITPSNVACFADYDSDSDPDLFTATAGETDKLFKNQNGELINTPGLNILNESYITSYVWGDYDNDGDADLFLPNWEPVNSSLYENLGNGTFSEITGQDIVSDADYSTSACSGDFDNDGDLDIYVVYEHSFDLKQDYLYLNDGNGNFEKIEDSSFVDNPGKYTCHVISADYDRDGDLDLYLTNWYEDEPNHLYRNNGNGNNWISIRPIGTISNRSAIGVKVRIYALINGNPIWQLREHTGYNAVEAIHFGLGDATIIDSIKIEWPGGQITDILTDVDVNQFLTVIETICSDVNESDDINILDIVYLINHLYKSGPAPSPPYAADVNSDGAINILDIVYLINYVYKNGPAPDCP